MGQYSLDRLDLKGAKPNLINRVRKGMFSLPSAEALGASYKIGRHL